MRVKPLALLASQGCQQTTLLRLAGGLQGPSSSCQSPANFIPGRGSTVLLKRIARLRLLLCCAAAAVARLGWRCGRDRYPSSAPPSCNTQSHLEGGRQRSLSARRDGIRISYGAAVGPRPYRHAPASRSYCAHIVKALSIGSVCRYRNDAIRFAGVTMMRITALDVCVIGLATVDGSGRVLNSG